MINYIALTISFGSLLLMVVIIRKKILALSDFYSEEMHGSNLLNGLKGKIMNNNVVRKFSKERFVYKLLSKFRLLTLKTENKTSAWLNKIRQKSSDKQKNFEIDDYWQDLKNKTKKK